MTIITAKLPAKALRLTPFALAALLMSAECRADWKFTPRVDLRETYSDNATLRGDDQASSQWISEAAPAFTLVGNGDRLKLNASGALHMYGYSKKDEANLADSYTQYQAQALAKVIDQLFYVDAGASRSRQTISAFGQLSGNPYTTTNSTTVSSWHVAPYVQHRFGSSATATLRYTRDSVDGGANNAFGNSLASARSASLVSGTAFNDIGWNLAYNHQDLHNGVAGDSTSETSTAGLRWHLVPRFSLTADVNYDKYEYPTLGDRTSGRGWSGGLVWTPSSRTSVQASYGRRYYGKTGSLAASHRSRHAVWTLDYTDGVTNSRSQLLLPSTIDTASMLDRMFLTSFPDPLLRQQAVQTYMAATGLPPSLASSINYLSNRYIRDKRLQGAVVLMGARSNLALSVFRDERKALSLQQSDSALLSDQLAGLNDNVRQRGFTVNLDRRLSSSTTALASASSVHVQSLDTGVVNTNRELRLGLTRRFDVRTRGSLEVRHVRGALSLNSNDRYHENAIAATLSVLY
jgi:uncharacterized protein (PEP-CTERM system associated)